MPFRIRRASTPPPRRRASFATGCSARATSAAAPADAAGPIAAVPSFQYYAETLASWASFPGLERLDVERGVGRRPELMRPPYGRFSEHSYRACRALGLEPVYWSAWALDWEELPPERIVDLACRDLAAGMIVLLHDSPRYADRRSALATAQAVARIAERAAELGLQLRPIGA